MARYSGLRGLQAFLADDAINTLSFPYLSILCAVADGAGSAGGWRDRLLYWVSCARFRVEIFKLFEAAAFNVLR